MRLAFALIALILLAACAQNLESDVRERDEVRLFLAMEPDASYTQGSFSASEYAQMSSLIEQECPPIDGGFTRGTFAGSGGSIVVYAFENSSIACILFRPKDPNVTTLPLADAPEGVAMVVNGVQVPVDVLDAQLAQLPQDSQRDAQALTSVITLVINDELLRQELTKIEVSDEQRAQARAAALAQLGASEESLPGLLAQQGASAEQFDEIVDSQARLGVLMRERLLMDEVQITDEVLQQVYLNNPNEFLQSEHAVMRHVLISTQQRSLEQAQERAAQIAGLLNSTDFCDLVTQYSDDAQRKDQCGTFIIPRGVVDPNLERASFETPSGQTALVATAAGVHLVQRVEVVPAQVVPFADVASQLRSTLVNQALQQRLALYVAILQGRSSVTIYAG